MTVKRFTSMYNEQSDMIQYVDTLKEEPNKWSICNVSETLQKLNELHEENYKIKSILLKRVEELNDAYNKSAKAGMPTGGIIGELDSFEEICEVMGWLE